MSKLNITLITLFPDMFPGALGHSLIGSALESGIWSLNTIDLRRFGVGKHHNVDDTPYGGGSGMVLRPDVVDAAITTALESTPNATLIYLTPRGEPFTQKLACELVARPVPPHPNPLPKEREQVAARLTDNAKKLRKDSTDVEKLLWSKLRNRQLADLKFKRQVPIETYIVDFLCEELKLIVELDGSQHAESQSDIKRDKLLKEKGYTVSRYWNNEVTDNLQGVLEDIASCSLSLRERVGVRAAAPTSLIFLCGRFESIDERVIAKHQPLEISLGDFVMTGGEIAAMAMIDACVRLLPGVIGDQESLSEESFGLSNEYSCLLEHPHYTKPPLWDNQPVPAVLTSGDHGKIKAWRLAESKAITQKRRPDLWKKYENQASKGKI